MANYNGNRFNTLLRFGLSQGGTGDLAVTKRAFKSFEKSESNPILRKKIFSTIDKTFDYIIQDDLLYNRFLLLLQKDSVFKEEEIMNYVMGFETEDELEEFVESCSELVDIDWISDDGKHLQFKTNNIDGLFSIVEETNADVHLFEGDIRG